ncbi:Rieske (2Fe-2S) protein [Streptomyces sp. AGS-58]|uniref:Rieske (2Fe-2S) protein n=1 Tax=unclassified Streptomyces TaxID=2593676 RepID=UPI0035A271CD
MTQPSTRRTVLASSAGALALGCVGCGGGKSDNGSSSSASPTGAGSGSPSPVPSASSAGAASGSPSPSSSVGGAELTRTGDIPVGGGKVFADRKIVVTQPSKGEFKAFSAVCTHRGCTVDKVADGTIDCPCHGSRFHVADGSVAHGPATEPLPEKQITVRGQSIQLA